MVGGNLNSGIFSHTVYGQLRERKVCASYVQTPNLEIEDVLGRVQSANTRESLTLKVFDSNFRMTDYQLMTLLKRADLESHGYKKEITTEMVKEPGIAKPLYRKTHFYFKIVNCSRLQEITQELQTLLPGKDSPCLLAD